MLKRSMMRLHTKQTKTLLLLVLIVGSLFASTLSVFLPATSHAAPVDQKTPEEQAKAYIMYRGIASCFEQGGNTSREKDQIVAGKWFQAEDGSVEIDVGYLNGDDGRVRCAEADQRINEAVRIWGYSSNIEAWCDLMQEAGPYQHTPGIDQSGINRDCVNGNGSELNTENNPQDRGFSFKRRLELKFYGGAGAPEPTNTAKYFIFQSTFNTFCQVKEVADASQATADQNALVSTDRGYKMKVVQPDGSIKEIIYEATGDIKKGDRFPVWDGHRPTCGELVDWSNNAAADFAAYVKRGGPATFPNSPPSGGGATEAEPCDIFGSWSLRWLVCPIFTAAVTVTDGLYRIIQNLLNFDVDYYMTDSSGLHKAWQTFRGIALSLLVLTALVMVVSQAAGFDFLDAYTIKKVLPRLLIAIIGMTLSWELLKFVIQFFNDVGGAIGNIITSAFGVAAASSTDPAAPGSFWNVFGIVGTTAGGIAGGVAAAATFPAWGPVALSLLTTAVVALVIGLVVLGLRVAVISAAIIIAPLAIAAYVLPGTKKLWDFWQNTLLTTLLMFPIVMGFLALGRGLAYVVGGTSGLQDDTGVGVKLLAMLVWLAPFFMLPFAFKLAGGLMKTIFSIADDKSRGIFDKQRKFRQDRREAIQEEQIAGKRGGIMAGFRQRSNAARHGHRAYGNEYAAHRQLMAHQISSKAAQDDGSWSLGDDYATAAAANTKVTNRAQFIEEYMRLSKKTGAEGRHAAETAAERLETSIGARIGSDAMQLAAFKGGAQSNTRFKAGPEGYEDAVRTARQLMDKGLINSSDAAAVLKSNRNRSDYAGAGFGDWINTLESAQVDQAGNVAYGSKTDAFGATTTYDASYIANKALEGSRPGDLIGGHQNAVKSVTGSMVGRLQQAYQSGDQIAIQHELAKIAGRYDAMAQVSPQNAEVMANEVLSQSLVSGNAPNKMQVQMGADGKPVKDANGQVVMQDTGVKMTIRELIEANRGNADFLNMRREYSSGRDAAAAGAAVPPEEPQP